MNTPGVEYLFMVNPNETTMDAEKADVFHYTIDKASFILNRARTNIQLKVPFLFSTVKGPDKDDWKKLIRMIKYLQEKRDDKLTLKINDMTMEDWYDDDVFAVHA